MRLQYFFYKIKIYLNLISVLESHTNYLPNQLYSFQKNFRDQKIVVFLKTAQLLVITVVQFPHTFQDKMKMNE